MTRSAIAEILPYLDAIDAHIFDLENGFIKCPGQHWHTTANAISDCKLFDNGKGFFQIHCVHTSCHKMIDLANRVLAKIGRQGGCDRQRTQAEGVTPAERVEQEAVAQGLAARDAILAGYRWTATEIASDENHAVDTPIQEQYYQVLGLFADDDVVWIGRDVYDTGSPKHVSRFRPVREWLACRGCPGTFICPSVFVPGTFSRRASTVVAPKFLVVESDTLTADEVGAVFRWLDAAVRLRLRAVVDTGGKSLHGWFDYPNQQVLAQLRKWLPRLGCDPALFNPAQPCRLPGAKRGDRYQRLIFMR
jgi:hypothetical protein